MESLRKIIRNVLRESVIEETQTGQKDLEKLTNDVLKLVAEQIMKEKAHVMWLTGNEKEPITKIPLANTLMMNGEGFSEIEDFVMSTNIRIAPTSIPIRGRKSIKGELEYGPPNNFNEEYYKIWLKYENKDLDEINQIFDKDGREVTTTDIYFKLFYMFYSTLLHELQHAYDAWRSKGKAFGGQLKKSYTSAQEKADMLMKTKSGYDELTPEEIDAINNSRLAYLNLVHEINARYAQAMQKIVLTGMDFKTFDDVKEDWNKVYKDFKINFEGWRHLSDKMKKKLTRRLAKAYQESIENLKTAAEKYSKEELEMISEDFGSEDVWYHGTPDVRDIEKEGGFTQKHINIDYVEDIDEWNRRQNLLKTARESGDENQYFKILDTIGELRKNAKIRKPIFLTNVYSVAKTYSDKPAFDYQNAEEKVLKVKVNSGNGVIINAPGQRFRFIDIEPVRRGFINAGVDPDNLDAIIAKLNYATDSSKGIRTDDIAAIGDWFGFDYIDVIGVLDSYQGGSTRSTVRMVFDPADITIMKDLSEVRKIVRKIIRESREVEGIDNMTKLSVFDFDSTLVNTPTPESGKQEWERKTGTPWPGGWWGTPESLDTDVFDMPTNSGVISDYKKEISNPNNLVVMMTGRVGKLSKQVEKILSMHGLKFHDYLYNDGGETSSDKKHKMEMALQYNPGIREIEMWDDRDSHIPIFQKWGDDLIEKGYLDSFKINHIKNNLFEFISERGGEGRVQKVYHGTSIKKSVNIINEGLKSSESMGYQNASWYMVSTDFESALFHATAEDGEDAVVFEFDVPIDNSKWEGHPYFWPPYERSEKSKWYALRQPISKDMITDIHYVKYDDFLKQKNKGF